MPGRTSDTGRPGSGRHRMPRNPMKFAKSSISALTTASSSDPDAYSIYVQQPASTSDDVRREAARTLATIAPPVPEPLLLTFASSKGSVLREFAPLALSNLGTRESLAALARFLTGAQRGTYESMTAAEDLGRTHDPAWLPLLLEIADRHDGKYLSYAAESGGDAAVPQ